MYKEYFSHMNSTDLPIFALGLFATFFVLMLLRTYVGKTRRDYEPVASLPFDDGTTKPSKEISP